MASRSQILKKYKKSVAIFCEISFKDKKYKSDSRIHHRWSDLKS